ncbi:MAG TPA: DUF4142 domain-containing protein [Flavipsychrobacter sp.]|nr:DUF4142 domain-containing protein [Flavipsychrobacter sp.]
MKKLLLSFILATATTSIPVFSYAQTSQKTTIAEADGKFISELIAVNTYEMMLTRMASQKALSVELRKVAEMMSNDHQRMDSELTKYANRFNLAINPDKREKYVSKIEKWDGDAAGEEWDKDITEELVDIHRESLNTMKGAERTVKDQELKGLMAMYVPRMQQHLDHLIPLKANVKSGDVALAANPSVQQTNVAKDIPDGNEKDAKFLSDLRLMNSYELQLMEMILKKGNHRALKNAAQHMLEDHHKLEQRVNQYAKTKAYGNDPDEASKTTEKANKWRQKKGGKEWDADIIEELIDVHKDGIDMLEDAVTDVRDDELKALMTEALPSLKKHLDMLEPLKETVKKPWKEK